MFLGVIVYGHEYQRDMGNLTISRFSPRETRGTFHMLLVVPRDRSEIFTAPPVNLFRLAIAALM